MSLEPIDPERALELYIADRENNVAQATIYSHRSRLGHFIRWCNDEAEITNLNDLSGRQLHEFRIWRRMEGDLSPATEKTQMDTLRVFIKWLESVSTGSSSRTQSRLTGQTGSPRTAEAAPIPKVQRWSPSPAVATKRCLSDRSQQLQA